MDTTDIEKKSLEAHVELCAERYRYLEDKLDAVDEKIITINADTKEIRAMLERVITKRNDQLVAWGLGIIAALIGTVGWLITHYVIK